MYTKLSCLVAGLLASAAGIVEAARGNITLNGSQRFLFDVDGNHISAYALKIYCMSGRLGLNVYLG